MPTDRRSIGSGPRWTPSRTSRPLPGAGPDDPWTLTVEPAAADRACERRCSRPRRVTSGSHRHPIGPLVAGRDLSQRAPQRDWPHDDRRFGHAGSNAGGSPITASCRGRRPRMWLVVAAKEFADQLLSVRFIVLFAILGLAAGFRCSSPQSGSATSPRMRAARRRSSSRCSSSVRRTSRSSGWTSRWPPSSASPRCSGSPRVRLGERRAGPGHAPAPRGSAHPPRRGDQRQVHGRPGHDLHRPRLGGGDDLRLRPPPLASSPLAPRCCASSSGWASRSSTSRCGWRSERSSRLQAGGHGALVGFGVWLLVALFGQFLLNLVLGIVFPIDTTSPPPTSRPPTRARPFSIGSCRRRLPRHRPSS